MHFFQGVSIVRIGGQDDNCRGSVWIIFHTFTTHVDFDTIEDAQKWLTSICQQLNCEVASASTAEKEDKIMEDLSNLQDYPGEIGCFELAEYKADKQATICIKNNHYSVPETMAGEMVLVKTYSEKIVILDPQHKVVGQHIRSYGSNEWIVDINHYVQTLMKKTSAIQYSEAFHQMPMSMQVIYHKFFKENGKEFLQLVKYVRDNNIAYEDVLKAADTIRWDGVKTFTADHFKVALQTLSAGDTPFREDQKSDEFIEIEIGSEDILTQLENVMEKGTKVPQE